MRSAGNFRRRVGTFAGGERLRRKEVRSALRFSPEFAGFTHYAVAAVWSTVSVNPTSAIRTLASNCCISRSTSLCSSLIMAERSPRHNTKSNGNECRPNCNYYRVCGAICQ